MTLRGACAVIAFFSFVFVVSACLAYEDVSRLIEKYVGDVVGGKMKYSEEEQDQTFTPLEEAEALLRRCYAAINKPVWESGETVSDVSYAINDYMSNRFGGDWNETQA